MNPYISIIIPVYNTEKYLHECLNSIINWSFPNWEAILINDGSTDRSGEICNEYALKDSRFKVIHKDNEGVSIARNTGLDIACGQWCWFVDSDDIIDIYTPVNLNIIEGKDIIMFDVKDFFEREKIEYKESEYTYYEVNDDINSFFKNWITYTHTAIWYKNKFWGKNGKYNIRFSNGIKLAEDLEFMCKCELLSQNPIKISHNNYYYRIREDSTSHSVGNNKQIINDTIKVLNNLYYFIKTNNISPNNGLIKRFTNLASAIPVNAIKIKEWNNSLQKEFRTIIKNYKTININLTSSRYIQIAYKFPWLLNIVTQIIIIKNADIFNKLRQRQRPSRNN